MNQKPKKLVKKQKKVIKIFSAYKHTHTHKN